MGFVAAYAVFEALLMMLMPGKTFYGPVTAGGNRPQYKVSPSRPLRIGCPTLRPSLIECEAPGAVHGRLDAAGYLIRSIATPPPVAAHPL